MAAPVCFNCGESGNIKIANTRPPMHSKNVCTKKECWDAWYKQFRHE